MMSRPQSQFSLDIHDLISNESLGGSSGKTSNAT